MTLANEAPAYRMIVPVTGTNTTYTVGRFEKPTIVRVTVVGVYGTGNVAVGTNKVVVTFGDAAGGTRTLCTLTNDANGNAALDMTAPYPDLIAGDTITFGYGIATGGYYRVHCINRNTIPLN